MMFNGFPTLITDRLILRQATKEDREVIYFLRSDPAVNSYIQRERAKSIADADAFLERVEKALNENKSIYWCITLKESQQMVGSVCLWNFSEDRQTAETGYDLLPQHQGKGIMAEALAAVLEYGFSKLKFKTIEAYTDFSNERSIALLRKANFNLLDGKKDADNGRNLIFELRNQVQYF
jgi:ribosomal-protein-alanine N-acetyltransferase